MAAQNILFDTNKINQIPNIFIFYFDLHSTPKNNFHIFQKVILNLKICY